MATNSEWLGAGGVFVPPEPEISHLVTEDDAPMDNFASEKQQRLLTETLYSSWATSDGAPFLAAANVGVYASISRPPVVPDVMVSVDAQVARDWWDKRNRCYFMWEFGKPPDVAVEIVSKRDGLELSSKLRQYQRMGVHFYVVYDPAKQLSDIPLQCFALRDREYELLEEPRFSRLGLGLTLWHGTFEGREDQWLRWVDADGALLLTGAERAALEKQRAESEKQRADRLAERLRALGLDPDE